jgi:hypothetical protein
VGEEGFELLAHDAHGAPSPSGGEGGTRGRGRPRGRALLRSPAWQGRFEHAVCGLSPLSSAARRGVPDRALRARSLFVSMAPEDSRLRPSSARLENGRLGRKVFNSRWDGRTARRAVARPETRKPAEDARARTVATPGESVGAGCAAVRVPGVAMRARGDDARERERDLGARAPSIAKTAALQGFRPRLWERRAPLWELGGRRPALPTDDQGEARAAPMSAPGAALAARRNAPGAGGAVGPVGSGRRPYGHRSCGGAGIT